MTLLIVDVPGGKKRYIIRLFFLPSSLKIANRNQLPVGDSYESPADMANKTKKWDLDEV